MKQNKDLPLCLILNSTLYKIERWLGWAELVNEADKQVNEDEDEDRDEDEDDEEGDNKDGEGLWPP